MRSWWIIICVGNALLCLLLFLLLRRLIFTSMIHGSFQVTLISRFFFLLPIEYLIFIYLFFFFVKFWDMGLLSLTSIFLKLFISEIGKQIDSFFGWGVGVEFSNQYFKFWILFSVLRNGFAEFGKTLLEFLHFLLNFPTWYIVRNQKKAAKSSLSNSFLLWIL